MRALKTSNISKIKFMLSLLIFFEMNAFAKPGPAIIRGNFTSLNDGDRVTLSLQKYGTEDLPGTFKTYSSRVKNHSFTLKFNAEDFPERLVMAFAPAPGRSTSSEVFNKYHRLVLTDFLIKNGDKISIEERNGKKVFTGKGSEKNRIIQKIKDFDTSHVSLPVKSPDDCLDNLFRKDSISMLRINYLNANKSALSKDVYTLLKADQVGQYFMRGSFLVRMPDSLQPPCRHMLKGYKWNSYSALFDSEVFRKQFAVQLSHSYTKGVVEKFRFDSCFMLNKTFSVQRCYAFLKNNFVGALRDRLIVNLLYENRYENAEARSYLADALTFVRTPAFLNILQGLQLSLAGSNAYKFRLPDEFGKIHDFSEFEGKIVIMDFWFNGCGSCVQASSCLKEIQTLYKNEPVVFLSINFDKAKEQWLKGLASGKYSSEGRINLFTDGLAKDHPMTRYYNVTGAPRIFLINKNGKIMQNPEETWIDNGKSIILSINEMLNEI